MKTPLLLFFLFLALYSCRKTQTKVPPCIFHSSLTLSLSDSLEIISCDDEQLRIAIDTENGNWMNPFFDTIINHDDTIYVNFNSTGKFIMKVGKAIEIGQPEQKTITVN